MKVKISMAQGERATSNPPPCAVNKTSPWVTLRRWNIELWAAAPSNVEVVGPSRLEDGIKSMTSKRNYPP